VTMSYPQQPAYPQYPPPTPPPAPKASTKTWLWIIGVIGAFIIGVAAGTASNSGAGSDSAGGTVTVTAPAADAAAAPAENPPAPAGPATTMGSGVYQVGVDVLAGQYKTPGPPEGAVIDMCYWARQKDDSGEFESLITNGTLQGPGSVTINDGEFVELTGDCTWTKVG
jgi:hypothetical protein